MPLRQEPLYFISSYFSTRVASVDLILCHREKDAYGFVSSFALSEELRYNEIRSSRKLAVRQVCQNFFNTVLRRGK